MLLPHPSYFSPTKELVFTPGASEDAQEVTELLIKVISLVIEIATDLPWDKANLDSAPLILVSNVRANFRRSSNGLGSPRVQSLPY